MSILKFGHFTLLLILASLAPATSAFASEYYDRLPPEMRIMIQQSLTWTGHFVGISDGNFNRMSIEAVRRYQASINAEPTGRLMKEQTLSLVRAADKVKSDFGYRKFNDPYTGATIGLPEKFVRFSGLTKRGSQFISSGGELDMTTLKISLNERSLADLFRLHKTRAGRHVSYSKFTGAWFVVAGEEAGKHFYVRAHEWNGDIRGFAISYPAEYATLFGRLSVAMSSDFQPDSSALSVALSQMNINDVARMLASSEPPPAAQSQQAITPSPAPSNSPGPPARGGPVEKTPGKTSTGTGFLVSNFGHFLTNAHVVKACKSVSVGTYGSARIIDQDTTNDLALLQIDATTNIKPLALSEVSPQLGEEVIALGFPLQDLLQNGLNATRGDISSLAGLGGDSRMLQITAAVQPGNSGGPLVNRRGAVVGIVTSKLNASKVATATGDIPQSINFAIRPELAEIFLRRFGISPQRLAAETRVAENQEIIARVRDSVSVVICLQ